MYKKNIIPHKSEVSYGDRCRILGQNGLIVWFTGLSGSGKSTIAVELEKALNKEGRAVYLLDGDNLRSGINSDLGYSEDDRNENIRRVAEIAALFKDAGVIILVSVISPFRKMREFARQIAGEDSFVEVFVKADINVCMERDPKGLYEKAMRKEITDFTGVDSPYEEPLSADIVLDTEKKDISECVEIVYKAISSRISKEGIKDGSPIKT